MTRFILLQYRHGEVAEWSNAPDSKSGVPVSGTVGSNPTLSAIFPEANSLTALT